MSSLLGLAARLLVPAPLQLAWSALRRVGGLLPRWVWLAGAVIAAASLVAWSGWQWHHRQTLAAFTAGSDAQAAADWEAYRAHADAAAAAQHATVAALATRQHAVSKGTADALTTRHEDLARRYDDLRLRWAAYRTGQGHAGDGRTAAISGSAPSADDAACAAAGWVAFDTAAAAAQAADRAIAKDDAWIAWAAAQAAAWPAN